MPAAKKNFRLKLSLLAVLAACALFTAARLALFWLNHGFFAALSAPEIRSAF